MGGDTWWQTGRYQPDLAAAFREAQEAELARSDHGFGDLTMEQLWQDVGWQEYILTGGTGTVLDQVRVVGPADRRRGPFMRPLSEAEVLGWCPGGRPGVADWLDALTSGRLPFPDRAGGNCTVLHRDGEPSEIGYWGTTAD